MPDHTPARWGDPFRLDPASAASLADALAATPDARSGPRWDNCPVPAPIRQQLRRMVAAQLLADRARRRALGLLQQAAAAAPVRLREPCSSTPAPPMPEPSPAQLAAAAIATAQLFGSVRLYRPGHRRRRIRPGVVAGVVRPCRCRH